MICAMDWFSEWSYVAFDMPPPPPHAQTKGVEICVKAVALPDSKDSVVSEDVHGWVTC